MGLPADREKEKLGRLPKIYQQTSDYTDVMRARLARPPWIRSWFWVFVFSVKKDMLAFLIVHLTTIIFCIADHFIGKLLHGRLLTSEKIGNIVQMIVGIRRWRYGLTVRVLDRTPVLLVPLRNCKSRSLLRMLAEFSEKARYSGKTREKFQKWRGKHSICVSLFIFGKSGLVTRHRLQCDEVLDNWNCHGHDCFLLSHRKNGIATVLLRERRRRAHPGGMPAMSLRETLSKEGLNHISDSGDLLVVITKRSHGQPSEDSEKRRYPQKSRMSVDFHYPGMWTGDN